ncbi:MAG TPA: acyl-CoA dehydrogenase [Chromatiales bacterium]|nr:acyl-CoA dehydrogenase [Chromatiales bacterium]
MDFAFTEEHEELRQTVRRFLEGKSDEQAVRALMATERGYSEEVWKQMAEQMALQAMIVPEEHGGAGFGPVELSIVMEEMGRTLLCAPYLSTAVLAVSALVEAGSDEAQRQILPAIAAGEVVATVALVDAGRGWDVADVQCRTEQDGALWRLTGSKAYVLDGHVADVILVAARTADGLGLFRVEPTADGLRRSLTPTLDVTRKLAGVELSSAQATRVDKGGDQTPALRKAVALTTVALAAEQVGGTQKCLEMSTEYAKTRLQFGRAIGSFQAVKHRCADMLVAVEFARSAAYAACFAAAENDPDLLESAALAKAYCSDAYFHAAAENIQIHGGIGFTWEHDAHLYLKRAKTDELLFGTPAEHRQALADRLGL